MVQLAKRECVPCRGDTPALDATQVQDYLSQLQGWRLSSKGRLTKSYSFKNFQDALDFVNKVGAVAENQCHHPDILLRWGRVRLDIYSHKINGLTENDFILAAKTDMVGHYFQHAVV